jgi:3-deoxy-7-phosphoheptulonate synthase
MNKMEKRGLVKLESKPEGTIVEIKNIKIGGPEIVIMAGPCAVENAEQLSETAKIVKAAGAAILRGGAYKPRTSPYSFQGLGQDGLDLLEKVRTEFDIPIVSEAMDVRQIHEVAKVADIVQIGSRNMQNFSLLKEAGICGKPVLLKRGMMATLEEFLNAAEYILAHGNPSVILCERGIRTFDSFTRNTLDLNAVPLLKQMTHLPIIVDPSHGTGRKDIVPAMAKAAIAAGADGLIMEVHYCPEKAMCDGAQALLPETFQQLMKDLPKIADAIGR